MDVDDHPLLEVPEFLKNHPELKRRGIDLTVPLKPVGGSPCGEGRTLMDAVVCSLPDGSAC